MIRHLSHSEIDKERWDEVISKSKNGLIYAYSWYLDIVSPGWQAIILNDHEAVMPLPVKKKFSIYISQQPFFAQQLGIFSPNPVSREIAIQFAENIPSSIKYINLQLNAATHFPKNNFEIEEAENLVLPLNSDYESIRINYNSSHKRAINKSAKIGVEVVTEVSPQEISQLIKQELGGKVKEMQLDHYKIMERLMTHALKVGMAEIKAVRHSGGQLSAAIFLYKNNNRLTYIFAAGDEYAKEGGFNAFLIDQVIREYSGKEWLLDLEGSSIPSIAKFYKRFGAVTESYFRVKRNHLPIFLKWIKR